MSTHYYELADNRCLGLDLFEVYSFPDMRTVSSSEKEACEKISKEFEQLLAEIHKLLGDNTCLEIIWLTEEANNQTFRSYVRVFFVLRKIGSNKQTIGYTIENTKNNIIASLLPLQFGINDSEEKYGELVELLSTVSSESVFSVAKGEQCLGNSNSLYPYYYTDVVPGKSKNGFQSIVTSLSQSKNCCISVQIFPTTFSEEELYMINEVAGELNRITFGTVINQGIYRDAMAAEPLKVYTYYSEHKSGPLFMYAILVFGKRSDCAGLSTKIVSLMKAGSEKIASIDPICLDLSSENIDIVKQFSYYPWNVNTRLIYYDVRVKTNQAIKLY